MAILHAIWLPHVIGGFGVYVTSWSFNLGLGEQIPVAQLVTQEVHVSLATSTELAVCDSNSVHGPGWI